MAAHPRVARAAARPAPDKHKLTTLQAKRLSALSGVPESDLAKATIAHISDKFKYEIDPAFLLFERICGKIVKTNPITHAEEPVPFATVHVYDVECSFFGYFPVDFQFGWYYPYFCFREELATVTTDQCGKFCVWVPRFDIDWIRTWRTERLCYDQIFRRPTLGDLIDKVVPVQPQIGPPGPGPVELLGKSALAMSRLPDLLGADNAERLRNATTARTLGADTTASRAVLKSRALPEIPPPLPAHVHAIVQRDGAAGLARHAGYDAAALGSIDAGRLDPSRFVGPFQRCHDVLVPEWLPIFEVPDIAFSVTQDINGIEQTIYDDGFFDVDYDDLSNVVLHASELAVSTTSCETPTVDCSTQGIRFVGLMPLVPAYHDPATGLAIRPNRPIADGQPGGTQTDPSYAPYTGTLQLYGCNHAPGAVYYRVLYSYNGSAEAPCTNRSWPIYPWPSGTPTQYQHDDGSGWFPVLDDAAWFPEHLLFEFATGQTGVYDIRLEYGDNAKGHIGYSDPVKLAIDNSAIVASITQLRWRHHGDIPWSPPMELICPVIRRPLSGGNRDIDLEVTYLAGTTALRDIALGGGGCGEGGPALTSAADTAAHWYTGPGDNTHNNVATFLLPGTVPDPNDHTVQISNQGAYSFSLSVWSRAFNPAGGDGGHLVDWRYNSAPNYVTTTLPIAIVDA
ncbi:MAG TPA: hypothetical protein VGT98_08985 [Candidatus Elarobacter sp.]|nr:hypothetical protein [Candidatus Elarobacter sp.]